MRKRTMLREKNEELQMRKKTMLRRIKGAVLGKPNLMIRLWWDDD